MEKQEKILITGNAGSLGKKLVSYLLKENNYQVIGVDKRSLANIPEGLKHLSLDLRRKSTLDIIYKLKPKSIIHLGVIRNPHRHRNKRANVYYFNLESTNQLLHLAERLAIRKFIYLSTANLYGPSSLSSGILTEDSPLHGADKSPEFRDLVSLDMMVQSFFWKLPKTQTIILRPCHIIGNGLNNAPTRYFMMDIIPTILGFDPLLQLIDQDDLILAISKSLQSSIRGIFNLAGPDMAPLSRIIKSLGRASLPIPQSIFKLFMATSFWSKRSSFPVAEIDHLKYACLIDTERAEHELKFISKKNISNIIKDLKIAYEYKINKQ